MRDSPLSRLINGALVSKGWGATDLRAALAGRGIEISLSGVSLWTSGGGIADKHRPVVSELLDIPFVQLAQAAAGVDTDAPLEA